MKEEEIIRLLQTGDEQGAKELLEHYGPLLHYIISPILTNEYDREECISEVTERVWNKITSYDTSRGSWTTWLTAIARNAALNRARNIKVHASWEDMSEQIEASQPIPEEIVLKKEKQRELAAALQCLSVQEQRLFYRKYYYLQSTAQIASELGMTERSVEGKLYRLKKRLRTKLGGDFDVE